MKDIMMKVSLSLAVVVLLGVSAVANAGNIQADQMKPAEGQTMAPKKAKVRKKTKKPGAMAMTGVPKGVQACIDHLIKMAEKEPLIDYEGHPSEIINGGLMWNSPESKCSLGDNLDLRKKAADVSVAWRKKDVAAVRSLLQELKSAAPQ
jgi:hypothetical protein